MSSSYTITNIDGPGEVWGDPPGMVTYELTLDGYAETVNAYRQPNNPLGLSVGDTTDGYNIDTSKKKPKLVKEKTGYGGSKSPEEQKSIVRQHSQEMALMALDLMERKGLIADVDTREKLWKKVQAWTQLFVEDAGA